MSQQNPIVQSRQFGSFLSFLLLVGVVWLVNWSGGLRDLLRRAGIEARNADGTARSTPKLVLLPGGKA